MSISFRLSSSVQFSCSVMSDSLWPHGLQHARLSCLSPTPKTYSNSCPLSRWCHAATSSSVVPFSSCLQSFPASGSFPMSQFFASGGQSIGISASASVLPMNIHNIHWSHHLQWFWSPNQLGCPVVWHVTVYIFTYDFFDSSALLVVISSVSFLIFFTWVLSSLWA